MKQLLFIIRVPFAIFTGLIGVILGIGIWTFLLGIGPLFLLKIIFIYPFQWSGIVPIPVDQEQWRDEKFFHKMCFIDVPYHCFSFWFENKSK